ncbi:MAG: DUF1634 domain-containing protein [Desulfuromonadales bacterium]|nr:DUF1634 domain-containing protein [Desulfuromonadales bacterium]
MTLRDKDIQTIIGKVLRSGVCLSLSVVFIGGVVYIARHGGEKSAVIGKKFTEENRNILQILHDTFVGIARGKGLSIIELGVLLLIATPLARVIFSLLAFAAEKDRTYVLITSLVLMIILFSMFSGFGG